MIQDLSIRNYSPSTISRYVLRVRKFGEHFGKSPDRAKFLDELKQPYEQSILGFHDFCTPHKFDSLGRKLRKKKWVVFSKVPFGGPEQVLMYLACHTHRVAISNRRLLALVESSVTFVLKDYAACATKRSSPAPFLRRFL